MRKRSTPVAETWEAGWRGVAFVRLPLLTLFYNGCQKGWLVSAIRSRALVASELLNQRGREVAIKSAVARYFTVLTCSPYPPNNGQCIQDQDSGSSTSPASRRARRRSRPGPAHRRQHVLHLRSKPPRPVSGLQVSVRHLLPSTNARSSPCCRFTSGYDPTATQDDIFENDVRPLIDVVYSGVVSVSECCIAYGMFTCAQTVTVFAYGVTSSGKTHTMQGIKADPGIIPKAVEVCTFACVFCVCLVSCVEQAIFEQQCDLKRYHSSLAVSYMEIYKDEVYDLLVNRDNVRRHAHL